MEYSLSYCVEHELNLNSRFLRLLLHLLGGFGHLGTARYLVCNDGYPHSYRSSQVSRVSFTLRHREGKSLFPNSVLHFNSEDKDQTDLCDSCCPSTTTTELSTDCGCLFTLLWHEAVCAEEVAFMSVCSFCTQHLSISRVNGSRLLGLTPPPASLAMEISPWWLTYSSMQVSQNITETALYSTSDGRLWVKSASQWDF